MAALARVAEAGGRQVWRLEFEVADLPFWWDNNLGDSDVRRMFGAVPPNALVGAAVPPSPTLGFPRYIG